jgi:hypothetical protein
MAVIIKSRNISEAGFHDRFSHDAPSDYFGVIDFQRREYFTVDDGVRNNISLTDAVTFSRAGSAQYIDRSGRVKTAQADEPRFTYIPDLDVEGISVDQARANLATSGANGTQVVIPSRSEKTILSYVGGEASLTSSIHSLEETYTLKSGRTVKLYGRSSSAADTATLNVSGGASGIIVESAYGAAASQILAYSATRAIESCTLGPAFVNAVQGGGTVVVVQAKYPSGAFDPLFYSPVVVKTSGQGGINIRHGQGHKTASATVNLFSASDGSATNSGVQRAQALSTWPGGLFVSGLAWSSGGEDCSLINSWQSVPSAMSAPVFGNPTSIHIGGETGAWSGGSRLNGVIARVIVYSRHLSQSELLFLSSLTK